MLTVTPASFKLLLFYLFTSCCFILSYHVPHFVVAAAAAPPFSFSFDFSNISSYRSDDLLFEGDSNVHDGLVDLTVTSKNNGSGVGRMSYKHPVPFYDSNTGQVASFATKFNFMFTRVNNEADTGDGMAFFLSGYPSRLPLMAGGGDLGLRDITPGAGGLVAVEFDTFWNEWDPCGNGNGTNTSKEDHMAIDIDTARNSTNATCFRNITLAGSMTASVIFNSTTRMLVASLQFDDNPSRGTYEVSTQLTDPVTALLPSEVAVGFSSTFGFGQTVELHQIKSWSFNSTLARKGEAATWTMEPAMEPRTIYAVPFVGRNCKWDLYKALVEMYIHITAIWICACFQLEG